MATAPVKSQTLHNFRLPFLRWGHKNRYRRPSVTTARDSPPRPAAVDQNRSSPSEHDSDGGGGGYKNELESENRKLVAGSRGSQRNRFSFSSCSSQKLQAAAGLERESNGVDGELCDVVILAEESLAKPWNLRPRKVVAKAKVEIGGASKNGESKETAPAVPANPGAPQTENLPKSMRLRGNAEGEKRRLWIALSREEIEEDVYAMTGSKPARRLKKRPKTVQKHLDNVFPGLSFEGVTADSYQVDDSSR